MVEAMRGCDVLVPTNRTLHIGPGVVVLLPTGGSLIATNGGSIVIEGNDENRAVLISQSRPGG